MHTHTHIYIYSSISKSDKNVTWSAVKWASFYIPVTWSPQPVTGSIGKKQASWQRWCCQRYKNITIITYYHPQAGSVCEGTEKALQPSRLMSCSIPPVMSLSSCDLNSKLGAEREAEAFPPVPCSLGEVESSLPSWKQEKNRMLSANNYLLLLPPLVTKCHRDELGDPSLNAAG